jgi:hypothetical protein
MIQNILTNKQYEKFQTFKEYNRRNKIERKLVLKHLKHKRLKITIKEQTSKTLIDKYNRKLEYNESTFNLNGKEIFRYPIFLNNNIYGIRNIEILKNNITKLNSYEREFLFNLIKYKFNLKLSLNLNSILFSFQLFEIFNHLSYVSLNSKKII